MICKVCGTTLAEGVTTCPHCGATVAAREGGVGFWDMLDGPEGRPARESSREPRRVKVPAVAPADVPQVEVRAFEHLSREVEGLGPELKGLASAVEKLQAGTGRWRALAVAGLVAALVAGGVAWRATSAAREAQASAQALELRLQEQEDELADLRGTQDELRHELDALTAGNAGDGEGASSPEGLSSEVQTMTPQERVPYAPYVLPEVPYAGYVVDVEAGA